jgi:hypothetical protein
MFTATSRRTNRDRRSFLENHSGPRATLVARWEAEMLHGPLPTFDKCMALQYPDWQEFKQWLEERYQNLEGYRGGLPGEWYQ